MAWNYKQGEIESAEFNVIYFERGWEWDEWIFDSICLNKNFKNVQKGAKFMAKHAANNGNGENESRENQFSRQNRSPGNQSISDVNS